MMVVDMLGGWGGGRGGGVRLYARNAACPGGACERSKASTDVHCNYVGCSMRGCDIKTSNAAECLLNEGTPKPG